MTSELSNRMKASVTRRASAQRDDEKPEAPPVAPFRAAPPVHGRRITLDLTDGDHRALKVAALEDNTTIMKLLRTLVRLWREDPELAARVRAEIQTS